ncbi:39S ribosomal protein L50, mitochondrial isoform X3 [Macrosteles quadrilineatus]|uniref:39S ribosomal protein L50, mitochondrial isoform X3 n=1 Tax=Macrosteles quadrilineatus TaxID=74068 RepID=UPI0023E27A1B|nr:39S ribosomal protein L50, mitochondrial isoform X3 [Macrosteles quadrilineatus]
MAALIKHVLSKHSVPYTQCRSKHWVSRKKVWLNPIQPGKKIESVVIGMAARGFLRPLKDYSPPKDAVERCESICSELLGPKLDDTTPITEPKTRFAVLNECYKQLNHSVPNSLLYTITTVGDLKSFYATPVSTTTPLDKMKTMDLPENLHVQYEPIRFHPETDSLFGGQTAYPKSSTLVTGLRTKKKYPSYIIPDNYFKE